MQTVKSTFRVSLPCVVFKYNASINVVFFFCSIPGPSLNVCSDNGFWPGIGCEFRMEIPHQNPTSFIWTTLWFIFAVDLKFATRKKKIKKWHGICVDSTSDSEMRLGANPRRNPLNYIFFKTRLKIQAEKAQILIVVSTLFFHIEISAWKKHMSERVQFWVQFGLYSYYVQLSALWLHYKQTLCSLMV